MALANIAMIHELHSKLEDKDTRLDVWLEQKLDGCSRSLVAKQIKAGRCRIEPGKAKPAWRLRGNETVVIEVPEIEPIDILAEDISLEIIYEDADLLVINKPAGMVVHPAIGHPRGTLLNALLHYAQEVWQPCLVHRLDADTSGLIVVAKHKQAHEALQQQFKDRTVIKKYLALAHGLPKADFFESRAWIGRHPKDFRKRYAYDAEHPKAKHAHSDFRVRERHQDYATLEVRIYTGRTHQIRVHLQHLGHPILADGVYGRQAYWPLNQDSEHTLHRQALHAWSLRLQHPQTNKDLQFTCPIPSDLRVWLKSDLETLDAAHG